MSKGQYNTEREQDGLWFFYNQHGEVESSTEYTDGLKHGENTVYFADSSIKSQGIYVDDIEEGRYFENNIDGSLSYEVTYHNGAYSREERSYSQNQLTGKTYLLNGMKHGQDFDYDEKGRIHSIDIFDKGYAIKSTYFDTLGNVLSEIDQLSSGKHMRNFANGNKVFEGDYVNGYAHGHFTYYYSSGQIDSEGDYFNGKQNGIWKWYYRDGTLSAKGKYIDGERQGEWVSFNENGKPDWKSSYYNGERHGMYADYSYTGNICYQAEYTYGKRNHTADYFSPDGTLQMRKYYDNNICRAYTYTGKDGKLVPPVKVTSATQTYVTYFQSGDTARVLPIVNGEIHGTFKAFHPTGKLAEIESYHYGFRHGTSTEYYASGQIQSQAVYRYGKITGNKETFYENGQLESKIPYLGGLRSGKASYFSPNGEKVTDIIFVDDSEYDSY